MRDCKRYVREHLPPLQLSGAREQEIVEEIAQQLEGAYSDAISRGASQIEAEAHAASQIPDWNELAQEIRKADEPIAEVVNANIPENWREAMREENFRKRRGGNFMADFWQDTRYAFRVLRNSPGITAVVVLTLALGIGANSAIFSVVNSVLLRPLPYRDANQLVWVGDYLPKQNQSTVYDVDYFAWSKHCSSFEQMTMYMPGSEYTLTGVGDAERLNGVRASWTYLRTLGVAPQLGRDISPDEDIPGGPSVVLMSDSLWRRRFSADPGVVGRSITLDGNLYSIAGVLPTGFEFPENRRGDLLVPFKVPDTEIPRWFVHIIARLKPGVSPQAAAAELDAIARPIHEKSPFIGLFKMLAGAQARVQPLHDRLVGDVRNALLLLLGAVGFVLLIACANVASLQLARSAARENEMAVRGALGASRWRMARQLLTENVITGLAGGIAGLLLGMWLVALVRNFGPRNIPHLDVTQLNGTVLFFTLAISLVTGILFGLAPVASAFRVSLNDALKQGGGKGSAGKRVVRPQQVLITLEVAMALMLLIGAGLLARSFVRLISIPQGFDSHGIFTALISLPAKTYLKDDQQRAFYTELLTRLRAMPGVTVAGAAAVLPLQGSVLTTGFVQIEGRPAVDKTPPVGQHDVGVDFVTPELFTALRIPLKFGRFLDHRDSANAPETAVVNEAFARQFFPAENPLGHRFQTAGDDTWRTIVGVTGNTKQMGIAAEIEPEIYLPFDQSPYQDMSLAIRTELNPMSLAPAVRAAVAAIDKNIVLAGVETVDGLLAREVAPQRFNLALLGSFAVLSLLLAVVGIYGVMAYAVGQRTHEIGIRLTLGAVPGNVLRMILLQGAKLATLGVVLGLCAGIALTRLLSSMLFEVKATDPLTFAGGALILFAAALAACWIPARRATKVSPLVALRYE